MRRAIIIHGWDSSPKTGWRPWLKAELEKRGFQVTVPSMPNAESPVMSEWLGHLKEVIQVPDKDTYLVGHSLGCITILRYLEGLSEGKEIGGAVLVAGFTSNLGYEELDSFFPRHVDWEKIKPHCRSFAAIHSDDDPFVSVHYGEFFRDNLGAELIIEHNKKHFTGSEGINELPSARESLLKMAK